MAASRLPLFAAAALLAWAIPRPALAPPEDRPAISADPGTVVRWEAPGTKRCSMGGRSWAALQETCYYPVDVMGACPVSC